MKKATKFLLAAVLGLAAIFTTSCALEIVAPENKWVTYEYPVTTDKGTSYVIRGYAYYTETPTKIKTYGEPLDLPAGLTIVAAPKIVNGNRDNFVELFGEAVTANSYSIKTFRNGEYVEYGESDKSEAKQFKMSYTTWLILYNSIIHENISTGAPEILKDGKELAIENVKWKKIIYYMAINKLTELAAAE